jgi:hypothetical protein
VGNPKFLSITNDLSHVESIDDYLFIFVFPLLHVAHKWKDYEKTMENFHKTNVHELIMHSFK